MAARDLSRLLRPRSIAVLGSGWAANVIDQCARMGFDGDVWPVHPSRDSIGGLACFASLADLPSPPDATFVGVNRVATLDIVAQLSAVGAGGATCFASGWAESGAGDMQAQLVAAAGDMPVLGPNCYGLINYLDGAIIWPDQHGGRRCDRGVAIISQSSNIAINLTMQARGLPLAYVACLGNAAQTGLTELASALLADKRVSALGVYAEGLEDPAGLAALAQSLRGAGKGMVVLKAGKSPAGAQAAASHTAALAGDAAAASAFFAQAGIAEVATAAELIEALKILHLHGPLPGKRICSLSCSGGEAGLVADLAIATALQFPAPEQESADRLHAVLGDLVTIANPLDYHTFIWGDLDRTTDVFSTMLAGYDAGIFVIDPPRPDRCDPSSFDAALTAIEAAATTTGKPAFPVSLLPENFDEERAIAMIARGVAPLMGLETALGALDAVSGLDTPQGWRPWPVQADGPRHLLDEGRAKALLAKAGVPVPPGVSAPDLESLARLATGLTPPLALKGLGVVHKTEAGAVRLGLSSLDAQRPMDGATGYLAEEMVTGAGAEVLIGLRRDPVFGATLTLGSGGVMAELLADTVTLVLPVSRAQIDAALRHLRLWPLLAGYRGRPGADATAVTDIALALQSLLEKSPAITEIELNPVMVLAKGAVAVDALIWKEKN